MMKHRTPKYRKKIAHILDELTTYLLDLNAHRIVNEILDLDDKVVITCMAKVDLSDEIINKLKSCLIAHHDFEYDEYWRLIGEHQHGDELELIGSLIDYGEVNYVDGLLTICVERLK